jgi:isoquinoline 1-oxidoreductase subunit beta
MYQVAPIALTRRELGRLLLIGGIGVAFCGCGQRSPADSLAPQWWVELHRDGRIRMLTKRVEMGQGAHTGLRTLLGEELDVDPARIEVVQVPSEPRYGEIITGGSFTVAGWHERMRRAGATARHMLLDAAGRVWHVPPAELTTHDGSILHEASGRTLAYGEVVQSAAQLPVPAPASVQLKPPHSWRYIGKPGSIAHHNEIITGRAKYGIDVRLPGMCFAVLERAPVMGARLIGFDDTDARRVPGFIRTIALRGNAWPSQNHCRDAVALVANNSWAAQRARDALRVTWDDGAQPLADTPAIFKLLEDHVARRGVVSLERGNVDGAGETRFRLQAQYQQPYLAHAPLEPPNATARFMAGRMEVWSGTQRQTRMKDAIASELKLPPEQVVVHAELIGGSFGRRLEIDYGVEAAKLAHALERPVQVLWTRSDDIRFGLYRSASVHRLNAAMDDNGDITRFEHRFAAESVLRQQEPAEISPEGADWTLATPLISFPYEVPNLRFEHQAVKPMVPCAWWRGTYWTNVTTAVECFIDELADVAGQDPLAFRLKHLRSDHKRDFVVTEQVSMSFDPARLRGVLNAVATSSGWDQPAATGRARGLACGLYDSPACYAAVVAEARLVDGVPALASAWIAVDVGIIVNPQIVTAQAMGGFLMGASAALQEQITWSAGRVEQRGFEDYSPLRMPQCPRIEVILVPSDNAICGVGEIVTPAAIAAVTNAISRLMGQRVRRWPIRGGPA